MTTFTVTTQAELADALAKADRYDLIEMVVIEPGTDGLDKVKAPRVCGPIYEVDIDGDRLVPAEAPKAKRTRKAAGK